ncbi:MAG: hypothetical protein KIT31_01550 [Deltaproteobacteria bacterium]|nr:hypothetical protein [Deltaproteobacteria bacterium]
MTLTRLIFAIQTTDPSPTRIHVSGDVGTPAMSCLRRGVGSSSIANVDGVWTADLDAGDYILELQVETWLAGAMAISVELAVGQTAPNFVYYGPIPPNTTLELAAFDGTSFRTDPPLVAAVQDPKDPWPPPPPPRRITLATASETWFTTELAAAWNRIAPQRLAAGGKSMPEDVLDGLGGR